MKRLVIAAVVLALVAIAAIPVVADGKFTAWNEGFAFLYAQVGSGSAQAGWGPNWDKPTGAGADNEWSFGYDGKGYGFSATLEFGTTQTADGPQLAVGNAAWQWFGAYFKPWDFLKVTLGAPRIDYVQWTYIEGFGAYSRFVNADLSAAFEIKPMDGLTIGLADYIPQVLASGLNIGNLASGANLDIGNNFGVLASYTMANLGTFTAQYKRQDSNGAGTLTSSSLGVGVLISAMTGISINAGFNYDLVNSLMAVSASGKVSMAPILVEADVAFKQVSSSVSSFAAEVLGEYDMGTMGVGAQVGYDDGNGVGLLGEGASAAWDGFQIYPYVVANFDNGSYIRLGFVYASGANSHAAVIAIPIQYVWAF